VPDQGFEPDTPGHRLDTIDIRAGCVPESDLQCDRLGLTAPHTPGDTSYRYSQEHRCRQGTDGPGAGPRGAPPDLQHDIVMLLLLGAGETILVDLERARCDGLEVERAFFDNGDLHCTLLM